MLRESRRRRRETDESLGGETARWTGRSGEREGRAGGDWDRTEDKQDTRGVTPETNTRAGCCLVSPDGQLQGSDVMEVRDVKVDTRVGEHVHQGHELHLRHGVGAHGNQVKKRAAGVNTTYNITTASTPS